MTDEEVLDRLWEELKWNIEAGDGPISHDDVTFGVRVTRPRIEAEILQAAHRYAKAAVDSSDIVMFQERAKTAALQARIKAFASFYGNHPYRCAVNRQVSEIEADELITSGKWNVCDCGLEALVNA